LKKIEIKMATGCKNKFIIGSLATTKFSFIEYAIMKKNKKTIT
jgi:hypothetical protein